MYNFIFSGLVLFVYSRAHVKVLLLKKGSALPSLKRNRYGI